MKKFELSEVQKGIYFDCQFSNLVDYNISALFSIPDLDLKTMQTALDIVVAEQEILRANLRVDSDRIFIEISEMNNEKSCLSTYEESIYSEEIKLHVIKFTNEPFKLQDSPLFRVSIIKGMDGYSCIICAHHIILDGISMGIFQKKLVNYYQNVLDGTEVTFDVDHGYSDFVLSENKYLKNGTYNNQKNFWYEKNKGMTPVDMLADFIQVNQKNGESNEKAFVISDKLFYAIQEKSKELEITVFQFFFACFYLLIIHTMVMKTEQVIKKCPVQLTKLVY